jgi:hypothetical protein
MSQIGYYRLKTLADSDKTVLCLINNVPFTKEIEVLDDCFNSIILKYLDKTGQYRFFAFHKYYRTYDTPDQIGSVNKLLVSILTDKTDSQNIGYKNKRKIDISADVTENQLVIIQDLYTSPRIYYYVGNGTTDLDNDWIEINLKSNENIVKRPKGGFGVINFTMELPENYTITML